MRNKMNKTEKMKRDDNNNLPTKNPQKATEKSSSD